MTLRGQAMHVHTYLDAVRQGRTLGTLETACRRWRMREGGAKQSVRPGGLRATRLLTAPPEHGGIYQALRYDSARLTALLVCLAPLDGYTTWRKLDRDWRTAAGPVGDAECVGQVRLFYALYDGSPDIEQLAGQVLGALPEGSVLRDEPAVPAEGFYLWEASAGGPSRPDRVLVFVAPSAREKESDAWVWPNDGSALPPLPGYLWETAKVRHEARSFAGRRSLSRPQELYDRAARFEKAEQSRPGRTAARERELQILQRETALAAAGEAALRTMHRTVEAASGNAQRWVRSLTPAGDGLGGPIGRDRDHAAWLLTEIKDEADTVRDAVGYAEPMARIGSTEIEQRLRDLGERSEFLTILQTSVIAAIGLVLAASQTLNYDWPAYDSLQTPFIVSIFFAALFLPPATTLRPAASLGRRRLAWVGIAGAGLAASLAWFGVTWFARRHTGQPAPFTESLIVSIAAAVAATSAVAAWRMIRSRLRKR